MLKQSPLLLGTLAAMLLAVAASGQHLGAWRIPGFERLELYTLDLRFRMRGARSTADEVAILAFDDRSYAEAPELWEQRSGWARVVRAAKEAGARVIVLDALFTQPERLLPAALHADIEGYVVSRPEPTGAAADRLVRAVHGEMRGDQELAAAMEEAGNVVLILHLGSFGDAGRAPDRYLARGRYGQSAAGDEPPPAAATLMASLPSLNRHARALGFATVVEDETGSVRRVDSARLFEEAVYAPLAVQAVARHLDVPRARLAWLGSVGEIRIGDLSRGLERDGGLLLNYRGPPGTFSTYSVVDLVEGRLPEGTLEGRMALVGATHLGHDRVRTPFSQASFGVEVHATLIDNLLNDDPLRRLPWWVDGLVSLLCGLAIALLFWPELRASAIMQVGGVASIAAVWFAAATWLFSTRDLWAPMLGPALACLVCGGLCLSAAYLGEGLQRRRLRKAFAHYLSDEVIDELLRRPDMLALGGKRRELTVLFSDIRDFTSLSERLSPEQLVGFLNTYLTPMTRAVLGSEGFLDKYIGDAIMAVFGAPLPREEHAASAMKCALRMHEGLKELGPALAERGLEDLSVGIGINTGPMVVGNMGAEERFDYTVAGDAVNLASRLEGLTKVYGVFCLVGDETRRAAGSTFAFREIDMVRVKGRSEPVAIHELLGEDDGPAVARYEEIGEFDRGLRLWREGDLTSAREAFLMFAKRNPGDSVVRLYLERLHEMGDSVPDGWSGVFVASAK